VRRALIGIAAEWMVLPQRLRNDLAIGQRGAVAIRSVEPGGPAEQAGLRPGDILIALDGETVSGVDDIARILDAKRIGRRVSAIVVRDFKKQELAIVPRERN
jgi:S1-C subfamily serine protease